MSFFNRLFRRESPLTQAPPVAAPTPATNHEPLDWDSSDAAELRDFLRSDPGRRFGQLLRQRVTVSALHAMRAQPDRLPWECGRSAGIEDTVAQVDLLADWQGALVVETEDEEEPIRRYEDPAEWDDDLEWMDHPEAADDQYNGYEHRR